MANGKLRVLVSWIGGNDLKAIEGGLPGPVAAALKAVQFDVVELLCNYPAGQLEPYLSWLRANVDTTIVEAHHIELSSPVDFGSIYQHANTHLAQLASDEVDLSILLSPGTPAMQAIWILLGKTHYKCRFYQASLEAGVQQVDIPFDLSAEYIPPASQLDSEKLNRLVETVVPVDAAFDNIVSRNPHMMKIKARAQILAQHDVPVLIYGETGTGKELFARAIHNTSSRTNKPFIALNCGAIPTELVDSVLFGHKKGAFTGASADKPGVFQRAYGGTLFLDEFGELEPNVQVRLLRILQENTFTPVGGAAEQRADVRLITATHRNLMKDVADGVFREDLFYRVAVGVLHLPPLREREGDLLLLTDAVLASLAEGAPSLDDKKCSVHAKNIILEHSWRGNVRELQSTLLRAALWSEGEAITADDMQQALFEMPEDDTGSQLRDISQGIDIKEVIADISREYIQRALEFTAGNKTRAAQLLGLKNYQTLKNWMEKYDIS